MKTVNIKLYTFSELNEEAKEKAISQHRNFLMSLPEEFENEKGEMEEFYNLDYTDEEVTENIEANEYIFFNDGSLANCTTYTGKHPKEGITELTFKGEIYTL